MSQDGIESNPRCIILLYGGYPQSRSVSDVCVCVDEDGRGVPLLVFPRDGRADDDHRECVHGRAKNFHEGVHFHPLSVKGSIAR